MDGIDTLRSTPMESSVAEKPASPPSRIRLCFMKQPMMIRMWMALAPVAVAGIYFFGWRVLALLAVCAAAAVVTEWITTSQRGKPVSLACLVSAALYALSLPPTLPMWMAAVGIVVGILFGKEVFGGFGKNWANPAIVGRAFVYVAFPVAMTGRFVPTFRGFPGGFVHWSFESLAEVPVWLSSAANQVTDAVTMATPGIAARDYEVLTDWQTLFFGNIGDTFGPDAAPRVLAAGSIGEVCAPLLILAGIYLLWTRTANWRLTLSMLIGVLGLNAILLLTGAGRTVPMDQMLLGGSLLYGAVFIVTEPVSAPRTDEARWMYGLLIGVLYVLIRWQGQFAAALSFAILLGNMVGPTMDIAVRTWKARNKAASAEGSAP